MTGDHGFDRPGEGRSFPDPASSDQSSGQPTTSIVVPAYNEGAVIGSFLDAATSFVDANVELLVVDDGSTDSTAAVVDEWASRDRRIRMVRHDVNRGLGAALRTGFTEARGKVIVTIDADLSHPFDTATLLADACTGGADAAFGSRFVPGGAMVGVPRFRRVVSRLGNLVFRLAYWSSIRDMTTGLRAYRAEVVRGIETSEDGFAIQLELSVRLLTGGASVVELPLVLRDRVAGESKMDYGTLVPRYLRAMARLWRVRWFDRTQLAVR